MVKTHCLRFTINDLTAIRLTCGLCRTVVVFDFTVDVPPFAHCPNANCRHRWEICGRHPLTDVIEAIERYRSAYKSSEWPFDLTLELPDDPPQSVEKS